MLTIIWERTKNIISFVADIFGLWPLVKYFIGILIPAGVMSVILSRYGITNISSIRVAMILIALLIIILVIYNFIVRFKMWKILRQGLQNPWIFYKGYDTEFEINDTKGCTRTDIIIFSSIADGLDQYKFVVDKTIKKNISISLIEGGKLFIHDNIYTQKYEYIVQFEPLKKGDNHKIILHWEVKSLKETPFLGEKMANEFDYIRIKMIFPKNMIKNVTGCYENCLTSKNDGKKEDLSITDYPHNSNKSQCLWNIGKDEKTLPVTGRRYILSWKWQE